MASRPHVILIVSDQHNRGVLGCAGDPYIRTPHLDRLAGAGTRFAAAYAASPLCVPSRMALLTGLSPAHCQVHQNQEALASHIPTLAHALGAAGYRSVLCGRMHFVGPDQRHGYQERWVGDHGPTDVAGREAELGLFDGTTGQHVDTLAKSGAGVSSIQLYDEAVTDAACARIDAHATPHDGPHVGHHDGPHDEAKEPPPLFLTVGFYGPHNPYVCDAERLAYYESILPAPDPATWLVNRPEAHPAALAWASSRGLEGLDPVTAKRAQAAYYGAVELIDERVGRIVARADERLGASNTIIIYLSDHGDMAGAQGLFWKSTFYEGSVGVPWIWRDVSSRAPSPTRPATVESEPVPKAGRVVHEPVSLLDLAPTLCARTGAPPLPAPDGVHLDGLDLSPALASAQIVADSAGGGGDGGGEGGVATQAPPSRPAASPIPGERPILSTLLDTRTGPAAMIRQGRWKCVAYHGHDTPQLFDLESDPAEMHDRSRHEGRDEGRDGGPTFDLDLASIRSALLATLKRHWDPEALLARRAANRQRIDLLRAWAATTAPPRLEQFQADLDAIHLDPR